MNLITHYFTRVLRSRRCSAVALLDAALQAGKLARRTPPPPTDRCPLGGSDKKDRH